MKKVIITVVAILVLVVGVLAGIDVYKSVAHDVHHYTFESTATVSYDGKSEKLMMDDEWYMVDGTRMTVDEYKEWTNSHLIYKLGA